MDYLIEINSNYFFNNVKIIKNICCCEILPVIKANAYGHGIKEIVTLIKQDIAIKNICVAYTNEAIQAKNAGWGNKIIIMSSSQEIDIDQQYQYFLYSFIFLSHLLQKAILNNICFDVHIKLNCGMNRFGFKLNEIEKLIKIILENKKYIKVVGICTHLPRINYMQTEEINNQIILFNKLVLKLKNIFGDQLLIHPFASKGINLIKKTNAICNSVRVGGILYGLLNHEQKKILLHENSQNKIKQIMTLKSKVIMIRHVKKNENVGYGENFLSKKNQTIAITSFGYGYGYNTSLLAAPITGYCNNEYLGFTGLIGMNALFFDITHAKKKIKFGDYIILTNNEIQPINAAYLSYQFLNGREYTFTAMLHESIKKIIS